MANIKNPLMVMGGEELPESIKVAEIVVPTAATTISIPCVKRPVFFALFANELKFTGLYSTLGMCGAGETDGLSSGYNKPYISVVFGANAITWYSSQPVPTWNAETNEFTLRISTSSRYFFGTYSLFYY